MTNPSYSAIAPYVFHSAEFGSEPIGDGIDGDNFISDLAAFRSKMNDFGIPVAISEDWDRPGTMSDSNGSGIGPVGQQVKSNSDMVHGHAMPFYHGKNEAESWDYIADQVKWYSENVGLPALISEVRVPISSEICLIGRVADKGFDSPNGHGAMVGTTVTASAMLAPRSIRITGIPSMKIALFSSSIRQAGSSMLGLRSRRLTWSKTMAHMLCQPGSLSDART